jgi:hypothetical protein
MDAQDPTESIIVGYWSRSPGEPELPYPQANSAPWQRQEEFAAKLQAIELAIRKRRHGTLTAYRGFSMCRLCAVPNGSEEYAWGGYRWPSGLMHYIEAHNVRPPAAFVDAVLTSGA